MSHSDALLVCERNTLAVHGAMGGYKTGKGWSVHLRCLLADVLAEELGLPWYPVYTG